MKMKMSVTIVLLLFVAAVYGQAVDSPAITSVTGESWLNHLHRSFDETSMGKTWRLGPATDEAAVPAQLSASSPADAASSATRVVAVRGADLYRFNCQGCHGESGLGAPPEIQSMINPVRATSAAMIEERMKALGMAISRHQATELANQSRSALLKRLHEGGQDMPSFHYLSETEIRSLVAYLNRLAGVPGAEKQQVTIQEPQARIGELIAKSTCHTCHNATGINPTSTDLLNGAIPPLSALPLRVNQVRLVRKVTKGAPVMMGTPASPYRGRMPVFDYLSEDEATDVYEYLTHYPPTNLGRLNQASAMAVTEAINPPDNSSESRATAPEPVPAPLLDEREKSPSLAMPIGFAFVGFVLLGLGCWITVREFRKIAADSQRREAMRRAKAARLPWVAFPRAAEWEESAECRFSGQSANRKIS